MQMQNRSTLRRPTQKSRLPLSTSKNHANNSANKHDDTFLTTDPKHSSTPYHSSVSASKTSVKEKSILEKGKTLAVEAGKRLAKSPKAISRTAVSGSRKISEKMRNNRVVKSPAKPSKTTNRAKTAVKKIQKRRSMNLNSPMKNKRLRMGSGSDMPPSPLIEDKAKSTSDKIDWKTLLKNLQKTDPKSWNFSRFDAKKEIQVLKKLLDTVQKSGNEYLENLEFIFTALNLESLEPKAVIEFIDEIREKNTELNNTIVLRETKTVELETENTKLKSEISEKEIEIRDLGLELKKTKEMFNTDTTKTSGTMYTLNWMGGSFCILSSRKKMQWSPINNAAFSWSREHILFLARERLRDSEKIGCIMGSMGWNTVSFRL